MGVAGETRTDHHWEPASEAIAARFPGLSEELLVLAYASLPTAMLANVINGSLITIIFADSASRSLLVAWYALMVAMVVVRMGLWHQFRRLPRPLNNKALLYWRQVALVGSASSGLLWGAAGGFLSTVAGDFERLALGFLLGGMGAGAVAALTSVMPAFYAFLFPAIVPFAISLAMAADVPHRSMAVACVVYLVGLVLLGQRSHRLLCQSLRLRLQNAGLINSLEERVRERTGALEVLNAQLSRDITERRRAEAALELSVARQPAVARFGERALSGAEPDTLFAEAVDMVRTGLDVPRAALLESIADGRKLITRLAVDGGATVTGGDQTSGGSGSPAGYALMMRQSVVCANLAAEDRFAVPPSLTDSGAECVVDVVIAGAQRPFGIIEAADRRSRAFTAADVAFLESIANMLAAAIERKSSERSIQELALRDPLTGLPNRALFRDQLLQALARVQRSGKALAVLLLDLDHFKDVNDSLGHPAGDRLLIDVGSRLRACTRRSEPPARLGGDEFAVILSDLRPDAAATVAAGVAQKIHARLTAPFRIDEKEIHIGTSVGITLCPSDGALADELLRNADLALYRAKFDGRANCRFYSAEMTAQVERRKQVEADLRQALVGGEFDLHYQPQVDLVCGQIVGAEALLRWHHPRRGLLPPGEFLDVAESSGLLGPIGHWVLEKACEHACERHRRGLPVISTAINVSPAECRGEDLAENVERIAAALGCDLDWLELEVTEEMFHPPGPTTSLCSLVRLRKQGVKVSIDDFGTGYSSLARLHSLPVDRVKIDRSFVAGLGVDRDSELIVRAMITLAHNLGLDVVGEGVETRAQLDFLRIEGCDRAQGFGLGQPQPIGAFVSCLGANAGVHMAVVEEE